MGFNYILFTDIGGSSRLWERYPSEYPAALERHNRVSESVVAECGGSILKGMGDGYIALFQSANECLAAAVELQLALAREFAAHAPFADGAELRVRIIAHGGDLQELDADLFGPALNRAARICQVCHPGQVLASAVVVGGPGKQLPEGANSLDLGQHNLRDLSDPEHLFQLDHEGFPLHNFPPLATLGSRPNNLLPQTGAFFGREAELDELAALLQEQGARLVTIVAPGGYGKSRLAAQLCANLLNRYERGAFEVRLASLSDPLRIPDAVAAATGFQFFGSREPKEQILDYLREKEILLHFDNFEHLVGGAALLVEILQTAPRVRMIVTSREALKLSGEKVYPLGALAADGDGAAVQMFADRAALVRHDFVLNDATLPQVQAICRKLEGVPLALELAAAWSDSFTLTEMLEELESQLELTARMSDVPERHRSVRASCDWSWSRLNPEQQSALRKCSVFRGGFFVDAAESVLALKGMALRKMLADLCDKSWLYNYVISWEIDGQVETHTRYNLKDAAAREYAWERLLETRDSATA